MGYSCPRSCTLPAQPPQASIHPRCEDIRKAPKGMRQGTGKSYGAELCESYSATSCESSHPCPCPETATLLLMRICISERSMLAEKCYWVESLDPPELAEMPTQQLAPTRNHAASSRSVCRALKAARRTFQLGISRAVRMSGYSEGLVFPFVPFT